MNCYCTMQGISEEEDEVQKFLKGEVSGGESSRGREKRSKERETNRQRKQRLQKYASDGRVPQHYRGYEALLVKDSVPVPPIPTGGSHSLSTHPHIVQCNRVLVSLLSVQQSL